MYDISFIYTSKVIILSSQMSYILSRIKFKKMTLLK